MVVVVEASVDTEYTIKTSFSVTRRLLEVSGHNFFKGGGVGIRDTPCVSDYGKGER